VKSSHPPAVNGGVLEVPKYVERPSVHSNAKRKAFEQELKERQRIKDEGLHEDNKVSSSINHTVWRPAGLVVLRSRLRNQRSRVQIPVLSRGLCHEQLHLLTSHS
jgi:hypothetical protein